MVKACNLRPRHIVVVECAVCKTRFRVRSRKLWYMHILPACSGSCALDLFRSGTPVDLSKVKLVDISQFVRGFKSEAEGMFYYWLKKNRVDFIFEGIGIRVKRGVYIPDFFIPDFGIVEVKSLTYRGTNLDKVTYVGRFIPTYVVDTYQVRRIVSRDGLH